MRTHYIVRAQYDRPLPHSIRRETETRALVFDSEPAAFSAAEEMAQDTHLGDCTIIEVNRMTKRYRKSMRPHGGSSGYYRVIAWDSDGLCVGFGWSADGRPSLHDGQP